MKRITVLVSNDLIHDQRVRKTCASLQELGWTPFLVGRVLNNHQPIERQYPTKRFNLPFKRGALFYAAWTIRSFIFLLFHKTDAIWANDLDTLWPAFLLSRWKRVPLVYDSHEYFTEAAGLHGKSFQKNVWLRIEKTIFPKLKNVITVNESIANIYTEEYGVQVHVMRNVPELQSPPESISRKQMNLPEDKYLLILQGAFLDKDRGAVEAVKAMELIEGAHLLIIGAGEEHTQAAELRSSLGLENKVTVLPKQPYEQLRQYTNLADAGLSLDKGIYFNYLYSLPNKLFDYIHAGIPVIASDLPEVGKVVKDYGLGMTIQEVTPDQIAKAIKELMKYTEGEYAKNLERASQKFHWEEESKVIGKLLD